MAQEVTIEIKNGSQVTVNLHGATITSWKLKGQEILFCSKQAVFDNKKAIRGGIPVVFPNFGPWEFGPQHGFARIKPWTVHESPQMAGDGSRSTATFSLEDDDDTRAIWNKKFQVLYTVTLADCSLYMELTITNKGADTFDFTTLLHTYLRVPDIGRASIHGLQGLKYDDKVNGGEHIEDRDSVTIDENYDRIYKACKGPVDIKPDSESSVNIKISTRNLPDIVVWNPWSEKAKAMGDFGDEEYREMLCVEAGAVSERLILSPSNQVSFFQKIELLSKI